MAAWRVAWSLFTLRDQIDAAFPNRSRISDGYIGDTNHQNTTSDHNPWYGPGIVTAADWTHDPRNGFDIDRFTDELAATRDPRIKYIIANSWILDSRPQFNPWKWMRYYGENPHTSHVHVSVVASPLCDITTRWNLPMLGGGSTPPPIPPAPPIPAWPLPLNHWFGDVNGPEASHGGFYDHERGLIKLIQAALIRKGFARWLDGTRVVGDPNNNPWTDGVFGPETISAVTAWQKANMPGTTYYGQVWWDDWAKLLAP